MNVREIQLFTVNNGGVQGVTEAYSGTQGMCAGADRGSQGVQGKCTGADRDCAGDDREKIGVTRKYGLIFIRTVLSEHVVYTKNSAPNCSASPSNLLFKKNRYQSLYQRKKVIYNLYGF